MIANIEARRIAEEFVNSKYHVEGDVLVILDDKTITKDYGWYFFPASKRAIETRKTSHLIAGGGPILVERESGKAIQLGTALPIEYYIEKYETGQLS